MTALVVWLVIITSGSATSIGPYGSMDDCEGAVKAQKNVHNSGGGAAFSMLCIPARKP